MMAKCCTQPERSLSSMLSKMTVPKETMHLCCFYTILVTSFYRKFCLKAGDFLFFWGNMLYVLVAAAIMVDVTSLYRNVFSQLAVFHFFEAIVPGPWHRPSEGVIFRSKCFIPPKRCVFQYFSPFFLALSFKFKTWDSDNVGIGVIRFMFHLLIVCYGNCKVLDATQLSPDDYFVYFFDILGRSSPNRLFLKFLIPRFFFETTMTTCIW